MVREEKEYKVVELIHRRRLSHGDGSLGHTAGYFAPLRSVRTVAVRRRWASHYSTLGSANRGWNQPSAIELRPTNSRSPSQAHTHPSHHPSSSVVHRSVARSTRPPHLLLSDGMIGGCQVAALTLAPGHTQCASSHGRVVWPIAGLSLPPVVICDST